MTNQHSKNVRRATARAAVAAVGVAGLAAFGPAMAAGASPASVARASHAARHAQPANRCITGYTTGGDSSTYTRHLALSKAWAQTGRGTTTFQNLNYAGGWVGSLKVLYYHGGIWAMDDVWLAPRQTHKLSNTWNTPIGSNTYKIKFGVAELSDVTYISFKHDPGVGCK